MKLFQFVFTFTQTSEALYQVVANSEEEAKKLFFDHPQLKELPDLTLKTIELLAEDTSDAMDLHPDRIIH
jgi:hypothetical protein